MSQFHSAIRPTEALRFTPDAGSRKMQGIPLVATWAVLVAAPWAAIYGVVKLVF